MTFDPYVELGVDPKATPAAARKAYRRKAKDVHPDAPGGDTEKFQRLSKAITIVIDPVKRAKFDKTGVIDEGVNTARSEALQLIIAWLNAVIDDYIMSNFDRQKDPRRFDLMEMYRENARQQCFDFSVSMEKGKKALWLAKDLRDRFSGKDDTMGRMIDDRIAMYQSDLADCQKAVDARRLAIEISRGYHFKFDIPTGW